MATTSTKISNEELKNQTNFTPEPTNTENQLTTDSLKQTAGDTLTQIKEKTTGVLSEQKENLTAGLTGIADTLRQVSDNLQKSDEPNKIGEITAQYGNDFARQIERFSNYLDNADFQDLARDVKSYARRQPALFIGGAFTVGLLLARFLKTSHPTEFIKDSINSLPQGEKGREGEMNSQTV
jgi:ElaB/YqjD/DUF883 family membrane-anchored ribosome-binding protein